MSEAQPSSLNISHGARIATDRDTVVVYGKFFGDQEVVVGYVPIDNLIRFLGPECGLVPADYKNDGPDAKRSTVGPVCVGGPYDGRRIPKSSVHGFSIAVPIRDPISISDLSQRDSVPFQCGEYRLVPVAKGDVLERRVEQSEFWWWYPPGAKR